MNLGQTMLSAATLVVLTALVLNANRLIVEGERDIVRGEAYDLAVNYAQALLNEVAQKKYDLQSADSANQSAGDFNSPYGFGPNSSEANALWGSHASSHNAFNENILPSDLTAAQRGQCPFPDRAPFKSLTAFNDGDDYHGYQREINTDVIKGLRLTVEMYYVTETNPSTKVYYKTFFRRVNVVASHPTFLDPVVFSTLITN